MISRSKRWLGYRCIAKSLQKPIVKSYQDACLVDTDSADQALGFLRDIEPFVEKGVLL